jgi:hypothetical protein
MKSARDGKQAHLGGWLRKYWRPIEAPRGFVLAGERLVTLGQRLAVYCAPGAAAALVVGAGFLGRDVVNSDCADIVHDVAHERCVVAQAHPLWFLVLAVVALLAGLVTLRRGRRDFVLALTIALTVVLAVVALIGPALWIGMAPAYSGP